jgi:uncharacterized membrane protein
MKRLMLLAALLLVLGTFGYAQYTYCSIDYPSGFGTRLKGINDNGQMIGSYVDQYGNEHALLVQNGKFIPLAPNTILGTEYSVGYKSNDRGDVVGFVCDDIACHGFLLSKGVLTTFDYPGASDTYAASINEFGTIVGYWDLYDAQGNFLYEQGFTYKKGNFTELTYPGSGDTSPVGNNDFNVVVGIWDTGPNSTTGSGFVEWMGQFTSFQAGFPDVAVTQADGINDLGLIVGQEYTSYEYDNNQGHGFLAVGPFFTQLNYPGAMETTGWGTNWAGQMVGSWYDWNSGAHGWLVRPGKKTCPKFQVLEPRQLSSTPNAGASGRKISVPARLQRMSK